MLVTALDFNLPDQGQTGEIVYLPEGSHTITPCVNGKPKQITIKLDASKGEAIAASFQSALEKRLAANVRPTFDFDHKDVGPASALPKRFFYAPGRGIMAEVEWTGAGRRAIESKDYSYFSPTFLMDDDGTPAGIPERGPLGALVNEPAFRDIPRIAASSAKAKDQPEHQTTMNQLVTCGLLSESEASKDDAITLAQNRVTAMKGDSSKLKELDAKIEALKAERDKLKKGWDEAKAANKEIMETQADSLIKAAVADGRIAPKDEDTKSFWRSSLLNNHEQTVKALDALPKKNPDITKPQVKASGEKVTGGNGTLIEAADALVKAGTCQSRDEAIAQVAAEKPELYAAYRESLGAE